MFKAAISKYMAHRKEKKLEKQRSRDAPVVPHGKQTVKQLVGQNQGISNIEITDPSIKEFEKIARKYGELCIRDSHQPLRHHQGDDGADFKGLLQGGPHDECGPAALFQPHRRS